MGEPEKVFEHLPGPSINLSRRPILPEQKYLTVPHLTRKQIRQLFSKIIINPVTGCWEWQGAHNKKGYGLWWYQGRTEQVHRLMYAWLVGPLPRGVGRDIPVLDHVVCDNPPCCNPSHAQPSTQKANTLRGIGRAAINAKKTHCIRGHLLPTELLERGDGRMRRRCWVCLKATQKALREGPKRQAILEKHRLSNRRRYWASKGMEPPSV